MLAQAGEMVRAGRRRITRAVSTVALFAAAASLWMIFRPPPAPVDAAQIFGDHLVSGDLDWLYARSLERSRNVADFRLDTLSSFYDDFLRQQFVSARAVSMTITYAGANKGVITLSMIKKDGTRASFTCMAFVENGEVRFPMFEGMLFAYAELTYPDVLPGLTQRLDRAWLVVGPWLLKRGIDKFYSSQDDKYYPVKAMMPKVKR
jgi:hypothetical protein